MAEPAGDAVRSFVDAIPIPGPATARIQAVAALVVAFVGVSTSSVTSLLASAAAAAVGWQALRGLSLHECRSPWRYSAWTAVMLGLLGAVFGAVALLLG